MHLQQDSSIATLTNTYPLIDFDYFILYNNIIIQLTQLDSTMMKLQLEQETLESATQPRLKRSLIREEQQAFQGAKFVYYGVLPACIVATILAHRYQIYIETYVRQTQGEFRLMIAYLTISYVLSLWQYIRCNRIDVTPIIGNTQNQLKQNVDQESIGQRQVEQSQESVRSTVDIAKSTVDIAQNAVDKTHIKPPKFYCSSCKIHSDYRTRHCKKCQTCIQRYDHHCFWIGNCVGRHNHRNFYMFLLFQSINNYLLLDYLYNINFIANLQLTTLNKIIWIIHIEMIVFALGFLAFTGFLFIYHTMLICNGITTWEHQRRDKISYLKYLPKGYNPFSLGVIRNILKFFTEKTRANGSNDVQAWDSYLPTYEEAKGLQPVCNLIDNQYYSCC